MRVVIGLDAAWTRHNPSGVALAIEDETGPRLIAAAASFADFYQRAGLVDAPEAFSAQHLIPAAQILAGAPPDLVAIDMPLGKALITARRACDNRITALYARHRAGTHSPSAERPGPVSLEMIEDFARHGFALACTAPIQPPAIIEVYPHPALIELTGASKRLPYKVQKRGSYWPELSASARLDAIFEQWQTIIAALDNVLPGTAALLPLPGLSASQRALKAYEDRLDAAICAWVGLAALRGEADAHGDATGAIWVPKAPC